MGRYPRRTARLLAVALVGLSACGAQAAADRFDYDASGRLIRRVDDQSRGTDYVYDPAGNVLQVTAAGQVPPPQITSGSLADQRRNDVRQVAVTGSGLAGVSIRTSHPGIAISQVAQSATVINFRLAVSNQVPLGPQQLTFQGAAGSVSLSFNVLPALAFVFVPEPISVAPDNIARKVSVLISEPFTDAKTFSLSTLSPAIAKPKAGQVSFVAGATAADIGVIGVTQGVTLLRLSGSSINEPVESMVFVNPGQADLLRLGKAVGVSRGLPTYLSPTSTLSSSGIGISRGAPWYTSSSATWNTAPVGVVRGTPWYASASAIWNAAAVGIVRGTPWFASSSATWNATAVGVVRGTPWYVSATTNPLVAPLVGITRP